MSGSRAAPSGGIIVLLRRDPRLRTVAREDVERARREAEAEAQQPLRRARGA